jgi:antitoxin CptB
MILPNRKAKIKWNCRRGMLELDLMLKSFSENNLDNLSESQVCAFEKLLEMQDPDIYHWLTTENILKEEELADIVSTIRSYYKAQ